MERPSHSKPSASQLQSSGVGELARVGAISSRRQQYVGQQYSGQDTGSGRKQQYSTNAVRGGLLAAAAPVAASTQGGKRDVQHWV